MAQENVDDDFAEEDETEFLFLVNKLANGNRQLQLRREIERREESNRIRDSLGLDDFELEETC